MLRAFVKLTPQKTDIELLTPFKALPEEEKRLLGDADQFFLEIMDIPRYFHFVFYIIIFFCLFMTKF